MLILTIAISLLGATIKLYLKDGTYQLVREYQVEGERIRFYATDRGEWEEMPLELVDLKKTQAEVKAREEEERATAAANAAEDKAEADARKEVEQIPKENGVYLIENEKLTPIKAAESKIVTDKKRTVLKVLSPLPLVTGKATVELDGPHASTGTANREPEFYIRLSEDERFGIVKMGEHKGNRVVEKVTIVPVSKENIEEPTLVDTFRKQEADGLFKIWPEKPMQPGEYAVVEYTEGKVNMQVWDFFIAPGVGK
ncbi:MAG TPA: hypothetical protein VKG79_13595 [Bryobacteraceae bacterium]|nr:hypothetical protein [Bryobacteraceae bacterium]